MPKPSEKQFDDANKAAQGVEAKAAPAAPVAVSAPRPAISNVARSIDPSVRAQATKRIVIQDDFPYDVAFNYAFLGTGQGGGRIANSFYTLGYRRVAIVNTTDMDFAGIAEAIPKLNLKVGGAAKDMQVAQAAIKGRDEEVWDLMTRAWGESPDYAFVCVGLGGGSGSGTAETLVRQARKYLEAQGKAAKVGAIVSLPPVTEGQQVARNALASFKTLLDLKVSPIVIIDNARIQQLYRPAMAKLHATANDTISQLFHLFNQLAAVHSDLITFDRSELSQLLDGGIVVLGSAELHVEDIKSPADVSTKIRDELTNNVLATCDLRKGNKGACLFVGSQDVLDTFDLSYFDAGFTQLDRTIGSADKKTPTVIHRGVYVGSEPGLQCHTMISELEPPIDRLSELAKKALIEDSTPKGIASFLGVND